MTYGGPERRSRDRSDPHYLEQAKLIHAEWSKRQPPLTALQEQIAGELRERFLSPPSQQERESLLAEVFETPRYLEVLSDPRVDDEIKERLLWLLLRKRRSELVALPDLEERTLALAGLEADVDAHFAYAAAMAGIGRP